MLDTQLLSRLAAFRPIRGDVVTIRTCEGLALAEVLGRVDPVYGHDNYCDEVATFEVRSIDMPERIGRFVWAPTPHVNGSFDVIDTNWGLRVLAAIVPACIAATRAAESERRREWARLQVAFASAAETCEELETERDATAVAS